MSALRSPASITHLVRDLSAISGGNGGSSDVETTARVVGYLTSIARGKTEHSLATRNSARRVLSEWSAAKATAGLMSDVVRSIEEAEEQVASITEEDRGALLERARQRSVIAEGLLSSFKSKDRTARCKAAELGLMMLDGTSPRDLTLDDALIQQVRQRVAESLKVDQDVVELLEVPEKMSSALASRGRGAPKPRGGKAAPGPGDPTFERLHPRSRIGRFIEKGEGTQGAPSTRVMQLQRRLSELGFRVNTDGAFGPVTEVAVKRFQELYGLERTGRVDAATIETLRNPPPKTTEDIAREEKAAAESKGGAGAAGGAAKKEDEKAEAPSGGTGKSPAEHGKGVPAASERSGKPASKARVIIKNPKVGDTIDGAKVVEVWEDGSARLSDGRGIDAETGELKGRLTQTTKDVATHGLKWGGQTFTDRASFEKWLTEHGSSYEEWEQKHAPAAKGLAQRSKRSATRSKPEPKKGTAPLLVWRNGKLVDKRTGQVILARVTEAEIHIDEAATVAISWNPAEHPRDRLGKFSEVLALLKKGFADSVYLPNRRTVERKLGRFVVSDAAGRVIARGRNAEDVYELALAPPGEQQDAGRTDRPMQLWRTPWADPEVALPAVAKMLRDEELDSLIAEYGARDSEALSPGEAFDARIALDALRAEKARRARWSVSEANSRRADMLLRLREATEARLAAEQTADSILILRSRAREAAIREVLDEGAVVGALAGAVGAARSWDAALHPRDRIGRFTDVIRTLRRGEETDLGDGVSVKRVGANDFEVSARGRRGKINGPTAAARAADKLATDYGKRSPGLGGDDYEGLTYLMATGRSSSKRHGRAQTTRHYATADGRRVEVLRQSDNAEHERGAIVTVREKVESDYTTPSYTRFASFIRVDGGWKVRETGWERHVGVRDPYDLGRKDDEQWVTVTSQTFPTAAAAERHFVQAAVAKKPIGEITSGKPDYGKRSPGLGGSDRGEQDALRRASDEAYEAGDLDRSADLLYAASRLGSFGMREEDAWAAGRRGEAFTGKKPKRGWAKAVNDAIKRGKAADAVRAATDAEAGN